MILRLRQLLLSILLCLLLGACAGTPTPLQINDNGTATPAAETTANPLAIYDPWEDFNRHMYHFNAWLDHVLLLPIVHGYRTVTPKPARTGIHNFFTNLGEVSTFANSVLQLKPRSAFVSLWRFVINSTVGIGGLLDPARRIGLQPVNEDFGQTLAVYGVKTGPYLVLPFFGPSTLRDSVGMSADQALLYYGVDPLSLQDHDGRHAAFLALQGIDRRNSISFRYYQTGSPFEYELVRFIYINSRALQVAR